MSVDSFVKELEMYEAPDDVFNPWKDYSVDYDIAMNAAEIRRKHLKMYLDQRIPNADYIMVAEAPGYQGAHFTGIAMTSERILLGKQKYIPTQYVLTSETPLCRTSNPKANLGKKERKKNGFAEPTATIVWKMIYECNISPYKVILWNIYPFHPFKKSEGLLSNRSLDKYKDKLHLEVGIQYVRQLISLNPKAMLIAIGDHSNRLLTQNGLVCSHVAHPSNGGAPAFRKGLKCIFQNTK